MTERRPRQRIAPGLNVVTLGLFFLVVSAVGLFVATRQQEASVERVGELDGVMADSQSSFVNYLLVGSDTREGADPNSVDYGGIGDTTETGGNRSDTIIVLHVDNDRDTASIMSIPRDLWVDIPGYGLDRVNSAYTYGPDVLVQTVQTALGVPINHYIEVDFFSFKDIIGALGGVDMCFDHPTRDLNTGLWIGEPGCYSLGPVMSLAYARSRYYEVNRTGEWEVDGSADLGRVIRQQKFLQAAVAKAAQQMASNPLRASDLINAAVGSLRVDPGTNLVESAEFLRPLAAGGLARYTLPTFPEEIAGKSVLVLGAEAPKVLRYFAGLDEPPPPSG
ncbi:MAG: LCP family protein [Actinomycetota bacterium]|nr:LCP family protein [Actinomycetota bacterium]MDA2972899.1 LCP family protein [Actinomycetota bacterium]